MPADATGDEIGAPALPRLCPDHEPVIRAAADHEHVGEGDAQRAREARAMACPQCYALNGRTIR